MAEAAQAAVGGPAQQINVVADAGYSNGTQAEACEAQGILPHVPVQPGKNYLGDGTLFDRSEFTYQPESDTFLCPAGQNLARKQLSRKDRAVYYAGQPEVCGSCALKSRCTTGSRRSVTRHLHDEALQRMQQRTTREVMQLRRSIVEHPFANLKYRIFRHPRFPAEGTARSTNGDQSGCRRLQSETNAEHPWWVQVNGSPADRLNLFPSSVTRLPRRSSHSQRQKAMLQNPEHRFHLLIAFCFVTV